MLEQLPQKFPIQPIVEQVQALGTFGKRLDLNAPTGEFFSEPWTTKQEFKGTPIGDVLDSLGDIGQARLLCLESAESYTAHADPDDRIHLAIVTNEFCYLVDLTDDKLYHLPADGQLWYMDTSKIHVAANWGPRTRIHLNIRVLLPKYDADRKGLSIKVVDGEYDWKQLAYMPLMESINKLVKAGYVTGFKGITEKELWINIEIADMLASVFDTIRSNGVTLNVKQI